MMEIKSSRPHLGQGGLTSRFSRRFRRPPMKSDDPKHLRAAIPAALPPQAISEEVLLEKYAKGDERTIDDVRRRVARALAAVEAPDKRAQWEEAFYRAQEN